MTRHDPTLDEIENHTTPPCPGACNTGHRQHPETYDPVTGQPIWCRDCQTTIIDALRRLPTLAADAASMPDGRLARLSDTAGRSATRTGSPSGSPGWDLADEIMRWVMSWEDALREHLDRPRPNEVQRAEKRDNNGRLLAVGPTLRDEGARRRLVDAVQYLAAWSTALLSWPDVAVDAGREILGLATRAEKLTGRDQVVHRLPLPCLRCDCKALRRKDGSELVRCVVCGACWDQDDYDRLAHAYADGVRRDTPGHGSG